MNNQQIGVAVSLAATFVSLLASAYAIRQARDAKRHQLASEAAYFKFGRLLVQRPWRDKDAGQMNFLGDPYPPGEFGKVPDDYPAGWPVVMCARNKGKEARQITVEAADGLRVELHPFICESDGFGHVDTEKELQIIYPYDPIRLGRRENLTLKFGTIVGENIVQKFRFTHGLLKVERR